MNANSFWSAEKRLERAKHHIAALEIEGNRFFEENTYTEIVEPQPDGVYQLHKLKLGNRLPDNIYFLAIESIEGLRAALDHCGFACATRADAKSAYFPFADSQAELETVIQRKCRDLPIEIIDLFRSCEPYKGGKSGALWVLNKLCNSSKHKTLVNAGMSIGQHGLSGKTKGGRVRMPGITIDHEKNEIAYLETTLGTEGEIKADFTFFVAFGEIPELQGLNGPRLLKSISILVENVIGATQDRCRQLGWLAALH